MKYKVDELLSDFIDPADKHKIKNGRFINFYLSPSDIPVSYSCNCRITKAVHIPGSFFWKLPYLKNRLICF